MSEQNDSPFDCSGAVLLLNSNERSVIAFLSCRLWEAYVNVRISSLNGRSAFEFRNNIAPSRGEPVCCNTAPPHPKPCTLIQNSEFITHKSSIITT